MRQLNTIPAESLSSSSRFALSVATTPEEVREVQRLRYQVFVEGMGLTGLANADRLDRDDYDAHCNHLIVRDTRTLQVVGTYRLLSPQAARRIGMYYSEQEFELARLNHLRPNMAEAGRACIHPDYRSGAVIMMLWAGLADYLQKENCQYLIGCASVSLSDGGKNALSIYHALKDNNIAPAEYRVRPRLPFPVGERPADMQNVFIPPLIKGYLRSGAWVCGEPAWDPDFNCIDLFMLMPLAKLDSRYARHFMEARTA